MTTETEFSEKQQEVFQESLVKTLKSNESFKDTFCKCWPCAKEVLELISRLPGLPPIVVTVIGGLLKAGDIANGTVCK